MSLNSQGAARLSDDEHQENGSSSAEASIWRSSQHQRWKPQKQPMTATRQRELIEEYVSSLPSLPHHCHRHTQPDSVSHTVMRDQRVRLAPSSIIPSLTAVYLNGNCRSFQSRARVLDYKGWILTEKEYQRFGYAVHTAVHLPRLFDKSTKYVLLGDPTLPAAQINCVTGTGRTPNAQLTVDTSQLKYTEEGNAFVSDSFITVRATKTLRSGQELWIDYGHEYWEHMSLYCPHCLEYGADEEDQMLICEADGCKRAWHQLCITPCLVDVPEGPFFCDIHSRRLNS